MGLPSIVGRSKREIFQEIKSQIWKRMEGWQSKLLSRAGKEVLIKSILQPILTYAMYVFRFPTGFYDDIEKALNGF